MVQGGRKWTSRKLRRGINPQKKNPYQGNKVAFKNPSWVVASLKIEKEHILSTRGCEGRKGGKKRPGFFTMKGGVRKKKKSLDKGCTAFSPLLEPRTPFGKRIRKNLPGHRRNTPLAQKTKCTG